MNSGIAHVNVERIDMLGILWKASGLNKLWPYLLVGLIVMASLLVAYASGRSHGQASESSKRMQDSLNQFQKDAKLRAEIQSTRSTVARDQLRQRWSKN